MVRFGAFEVDFAASELRKNGALVRIQEQPLRILEALLESPGELVTRERLKERLWPSDTFVDFERSLNAAVAKLRQVLRDSADEPIYVETVARKGYRFIAPVTRAEPVPSLPVEPAKPYDRRRRWVAIAAILVCASALALFFRRAPSSEAHRSAIRSTRFSLALPPGARIANEPSLPSMAISPDGRTLAVVLAEADAPPSIWLRPMDSEVMHRLDGTAGVSLPFWSPDGTEIGFFSGDQLKRISVSGGPTRVLCDSIVAAGGASWGRTGTIIYSSNSVLHAVEASGGPCRQLTHLDAASELRHAWPQFLPDGRQFIHLVAATDPARNAMVLASLDKSERYALLKNVSRALFAPPDHLVFVQDGTLLAQRWDFHKHRSLQAPVQLADDPVPFISNVNPVLSGSSAISISENGVLAYRTRAEPRRQIVLYSRAGKRLRSIGPEGPYAQLTLSPDEKTFGLLAVTNVAELTFRIWLMRLDSEVLTRLDFGRTTNADPVWSPDSRRIVFCSFDVQERQSDLYEWTVGEDKPRVLLSDGRSNKPDDWSQDGRIVVYRRDNRVILALGIPEGKPIPTGDNEQFRKDQSQLSPGGQRIAYHSDRGGGRHEVFVANFPSFTGTVQVSSEGGVQPLWSSKGDALYYLAPSKRLMMVQVHAGGAFEASAPKALFRTAILGVPWGSQYAVSRDGQQVYILEPVPLQQDTVHIVTGWDAKN